MLLTTHKIIRIGTNYFLLFCIKYAGENKELVYAREPYMIHMKINLNTFEKSIQFCNSVFNNIHSLFSSNAEAILFKLCLCAIFDIKPEGNT